MGSTYMTDPIIFLIDTVFSLYILALLLRFLLQWCGGNFYNPISQFLVKITHPPLKIMRRFVPSIGKIDTSSLVLIIGLQMLTDFSILLLKDVSINIGALAIVSITQLLTLLINVFVFAIFAKAILSWMNPGTFNAASSILDTLYTVKVNYLLCDSSCLMAHRLFIFVFICSFCASGMSKSNNH